MYRDYFEAGFRVFGLHGVTKGVCDCGNAECDAFYKHPRVSHWQHTPKWSLDQFDVMELTGQFSTGFGVLCDGYLIIDIDPRNGGNDGYKQLEKDTGINFKDLSKFVVETGGGGWHIYFKHDGAERLHSHLKKYKGIDFKSSGFVVGAGSIHASGNTYEVYDGFPDEIEDLPQVLFDLLVKKVSVSSFNAVEDEITLQEIQEYLRYVPNTDVEYDDWVEIGMIIHESLGADSFMVWEQWSSTSKKHDPKMMEYKWYSFGKNPSKVTVGTLIQKAKDGGYIEPVTFETNLTYDVDLLDVSDIDNKKAAGITGDIINYINSQSRFPREWLAVSTALTTVSNIAGMRFEDEVYGVTPNLFCFNVAGSATGKEAIQQAHADLTIAAGVGKAIYGTIKSEQEIYRNIMRNQLTGYVIDEFGIFLNKIETASKTGASSYLGGVVGALMSIYSKANGNLALGADFSEDLLNELNKKIANTQKMIDENTAKDFHHDALKSMLALQIELMQGHIKNPYLTLSGYTTPATFNNLVSYAQATNGFIGRSIIFEEKDNNPKAKKGFKKGKLSDHLKHELLKLRNGGNAQVYDEHRIEFNGDKTPIRTNGDACELLETIQDELYERAALAMETNGLEAIVRRAFELVLKVSMVLAIGDGFERKVNHVRWAYALVKKDLENKINLTSANMAEQEKNISEEILAKVTHKLDQNTNITYGAIKNKLRSISPEHIQAALNYLVVNNLAVEEEPKNKTGSQSKKYSLA